MSSPPTEPIRSEPQWRGILRSIPNLPSLIAGLFGFVFFVVGLWMLAGGAWALIVTGIAFLIVSILIFEVPSGPRPRR